MKTMNLKKAFHYHLVLVVPLLITLFLVKYDYLEIYWLMIYALLDILIIRPIVNRKRLALLGIEAQDSYWKIVFIFPFKYYSQLMFKSI